MELGIAQSTTNFLEFNEPSSLSDEKSTEMERLQSALAEENSCLKIAHGQYLTKCFRMRFEEFVGSQNKDIKGSDSTKQELRDSLDADAINLVYEDSSTGEILGSCRINVRDHSKSPYRALYGLDFLESIAQTRGIAIASKLVVKPGSRGRGIMLPLIQGVVRVALEYGCPYLLAGCETRLVPLYKQFGMTRYKENLSVEGFGDIVPLIINLTSNSLVGRKKEMIEEIFERNLVSTKIRRTPLSKDLTLAFQSENLLAI